MASTNVSLTEGKFLSHPPSGEEVVISGMSGMLPESNNLHEFMTNLFNKFNMVTPTHRWGENRHPEMPRGTGTVPQINKFDAGFFGENYEESHSNDPFQRMLLERVIEAVFDAGLHPSELENTKTSVVVGACSSDFEGISLKMALNRNTIIGGMRAMVPHKISKFLKLNGSSFVVDTACSSSLTAVEHAFRLIRCGLVDNVIVGGVSQSIEPFVTIQFMRLGVLSPEAICRTFDAEGKGYVRSEAFCVLLLQKAKFAKRNYAQIVHAKTACDGFKEKGITFPSSNDQMQLFSDFYDECSIKPSSLTFLETHGTGTPVGDPEECSAIDQVFTKGRKTPLYIGSVKSNIGHAEGASGLPTLMKGIIAFHTGFIPPNINFNEPRKEIRGIIEDRLKVVTEKTPLPDNNGLIGGNSFGFGGGNCHVLLRKNFKEKSKILFDKIPRLVCVSGRTEQAVIKLLDGVKSCNFDIEYLRLYHDIFRKNISNHIFRGYSIVSPDGEISRQNNIFSELNSMSLYVTFGELTNSLEIGNKLMVLPPFAGTLKNIQKCLLSQDINLNEIFSDKSKNSDFYHILCSVITQIALADLIKLAGVKICSNLGYSYGELAAAYMDGVLSLEETVNCALVFNEAFNTVKYFIDRNDALEKDKNSHANEWEHYSTLNGHIDENYKDLITDFNKNDLKDLKLNLRKKLSNIIQKPKMWKVNETNEIHATAEYFYNSFSKKTNSTSFISIKKNSLLLKIGQVDLGEQNDEVTLINVFPFDENNHLVNLLKCLGNLYCNGQNPKLFKLYPEISFPVSNGTEMISPYIEWNHSKSWNACMIKTKSLQQVGSKNVKIILKDKQWEFISGHVIDGRILFPAMGYLFITWQFLAELKEINIEALNVVFQNCKFLRATPMPKDGTVKFNITIQKDGNFEIIEGDSLVVTGEVYAIEDNNTFIESFKANIPNGEKHDMKIKDIYKELRLRGYNYKNEFRSVQKCNVQATEAYIKWDNNWITFMDNMLQLLILQTDTRLLYVPTYIKNVTIAATEHLEWLKGISAEDKTIRIKASPYGDKIDSGFIHLSGLIASSIARRKDMGIPVLEKHVFVPNCASLSIEESIRVNAQIILENDLSYKVKAVEVVDDYTPENELLLAPMLQSAIEDQPLVGLLLTVLSKRSIETSFASEDSDLGTDNDYTLVIVSKLLERPDLMQNVLASVVENGFIISRENISFNVPDAVRNLSVITEHVTPNEKIVLLKKLKYSPKPHFIDVDDCVSFSWIEQIQNVIKSKNNQNVVIKAEGNRRNGIMGFVNCLRREPESPYFRCLFVMDKDANINYEKQLNKNMAVNVYKNGVWGTYRHLLINKVLHKESEHCYVLSTVRGDLSSLKWYEGPLTHRTKPIPETTLVNVNYCSVNFRDVMTASGRINVDVVTRDRLEQEAVQGFEFAGIDEEGNRVCAMTSCLGLATIVEADKGMLLKVPDDMWLRDAATIPVVYGTVLYGLVIRGKIKRGESILIHSGTGGVGQAAIRIALSYDCTVFTTVGSQEKKLFLLKTFPQLKDSHIGNSRDISFEQMVYKETRGRGVDLVLNSLAEEKLYASARCLTKYGRFLEIGKFDLGNNNDFNMLLFQKHASFHGVMLDKLMKESPSIKRTITNLIMENLKNKVIRPLNSTVFKYDEIQQAFRYMGTGKHTGKVLIEVKPENENSPTREIRTYPCGARYICDSEKTYIIVGGLGGFGLELADWLILRGARKLVLTSRKGITTGYQKYRTRIWGSYGVIVHISHDDIRTESGCRELLKESERIGSVDAIFNLAVVLADAVFENQTSESFHKSFEPKAFATNYLDIYSRELCPNLRNFVVFSSVSCGRGNAGQTNYGMANSVMERICEKRREEGYPAVAIQWGAIGEVGLVAEMQEEHLELEIGGTLQQKISNCMKVLDVLLKQDESVIVSSMVVAEKRGGSDAADIIDAVLNILGIADSKAVSSHASFAELGMDSMVAVEIKQTLEREYDVFLSPKELRTLTIAKLREIQEEKASEKFDKKNTSNLGVGMLFGKLSSDITSTSSLIKLNSLTGTVKRKKVLFFPGLEGTSFALEHLAKNIEADVYCLQYYNKASVASVKAFAKAVLPFVLQTVTKEEPFTFVAYSYGGVIAMEVAHMLEMQGYQGSIFLIESSPVCLKTLVKILLIEQEKHWEEGLIDGFMSLYLSEEEIQNQQENIKNCSCWDDRVKLLVKIFKEKTAFDPEFVKEAMDGVREKIRILNDYEPSFDKLEADIHLVKATAMDTLGFDEDYGISKHSEHQVKVDVLEGDHQNVVENQLLISILNSWLVKH